MEPALETRAGEPLDQAAIQRDFRRLWDTGRFVDLRVERSGPEAAPEVTFRAVEKPPLYLHEVKIRGDAGPKPAVAAGATIDALGAQQAVVALQRDLRRDGYRDAVVRAWTEPAGARQVDLHMDVERGPRYRVDQVRFSGDLALPVEDLRSALEATRPRTVIPGIWRMRPAGSPEAVESDVARLRGLYASRGYFRADVTASEVLVDPDGRLALEYRIGAGPRSRVGAVRVEGRAVEGRGEWSRGLCSCLFEARRKARAEGRMAFDVRLEATERAGDVVDLDARIEAGPAYAVGRIEFRGHHSYSDATLRRAMTLAEGDLFDWNRVYQSFQRVNALDLFAPIGERNVRITQDAGRGVANLTLSLEERSRGQWSLSGPLGPVSVGGPFNGSLAARLPTWGRGVLETSTYYASVGFLGLGPLARYLLFAPRGNVLLYASLARPYLPGQEWVSGFTVSPQWSWKASAFGYGVTQGRQRLRGWLAGGAREQAIVAPVGLGRRPALLCEDRGPRWKWLRGVVGVAMDLLVPGTLL